MSRLLASGFHVAVLSITLLAVIWVITYFRVNGARYAHTRFVSALGAGIFSIRWGLVPMYLGLWLVIGLYNIVFFKEMVEVCRHMGTLTEADLMLFALGLVDMTMIANLVVMTTIGGYSIFVKEFDYMTLTDRPRWLKDISSSTQKIKMGMSLIGISLVHLLKSFIGADTVSWNDIAKEALIAGIFLLATYVAVPDRWSAAQRRNSRRPT